MESKMLRLEWSEDDNMDEFFSNLLGLGYMLGESGSHLLFKQNKGILFEPIPECRDYN